MVVTLYCKTKLPWLPGLGSGMFCCICQPLKFRDYRQMGVVVLAVAGAVQRVRVDTFDDV